jgi:hypothetical protein
MLTHLDLWAGKQKAKVVEHRLMGVIVHLPGTLKATWLSMVLCSEWKSGV